MEIKNQKHLIHYFSILLLTFSVIILFFTVKYINDNQPPRQIIYPNPVKNIQTISFSDEFDKSVIPTEVTAEKLSSLSAILDGKDISSISADFKQFKDFIFKLNTNK